MSYELLIHEYLDTGLDDVREEALFAEVARNPEVRHEFNSQLRLNNIAKMDLNSINPPSDVTNNIFNKLDFASPTAANKTTWSKANIAFLATLIGIALGAGSIFGLLRNTESNKFGILDQELNIPIASSRSIDEKDISDSDNQNIASLVNLQKDLKKQNPSTQSNTSSTDDLETNSSSNYPKNRKSLSNSNHSLNSNNSKKSINSERKDTKSLQDYLNSKTYKPRFIRSGDSKKYFDALKKLGSTRNKNDISISNIESSSDLVITDVSVDELYDKNSNMISQNFTSENYSSSNPLKIGPDNTKWSIGIRQLNQINIEPNVNDQNSVFLNRSFFVNYKLNSAIVLVAEMGSEKFVQDFQQNIAGTNVQTVQNPILNWYGAGAKFRAEGIFGQYFATPFIQTLFAANSIGPILRPTIGIDLRLNNLFAIQVSYDRPILFYSVFGENLSSSKDGFTIGFNINF